MILGTGESWVLPWHRFLHARLDDEKLVLTFAEHRVEIRGRNLVAMLDRYLADMKLSAIRELPSEYVVTCEPNTGFITSITIEAVG